LETLCALYNGTPAGSQLPATYIDMDTPATPHRRQQQQQQQQQQPSTPPPDASSIASAKRQLEQAGGKIIFLLSVRNKHDHLAFIEMPARRIVMLSMAPERLVRHACSMALLWAREVLDTDDKFKTRQYQPRDREVPSMSGTHYLCWAANDYLLRGNGAVAAENTDGFLGDTIRRLNPPSALQGGCGR
jgi:hypothetical protein